MLKDLKIKRFTEDPKAPTLGVLMIVGVPRFITMEPPREGEIVCIPKGEYSCIKTFGRITSGGLRIEETLEVANVPERSGILFHVGNEIKDTHGCILIGDGFSSENFILNSRKSFFRFIESLENEAKFSLTISEC